MEIKEKIGRNSSGFTLIELMVALAVAAILLLVAIPNFREIIMDNRISVKTNEVVNIINFARTEAVRLGTSVGIRADDSSVNTNEWGQGISVWLDADDDGNYDAGEEIRVVGSFGDGITLDSDGTDGFNFLPDGTTNLGGTEVLNLCDSRAAETGRRFDILASGLVRTSTVTVPCA